jgi:hypothetical protein
MFYKWYKKLPFFDVPLQLNKPICVGVSTRLLTPYSPSVEAAGIEVQKNKTTAPSH